MSWKGSALREIVSGMHGFVVAAEVGTLRDADPVAEQADGWSTLHLARALMSRGVLYSIDVDRAAVRTAMMTLPRDLRGSVRWVCDDGARALRVLPVERLDLLILDGSDDPAETLREFEAAQTLLGKASVVVVDDVHEYGGMRRGKGTLVLPRVAELGWSEEERACGPWKMAVLTAPSA